MVRAAAESARIVQSCGIEHGYPGYADAVAKEPANPKIWKIVLDRTSTRTAGSTSPKPPTPAPGDQLPIPPALSSGPLIKIKV